MAKYSDIALIGLVVGLAALGIYGAKQAANYFKGLTPQLPQIPNITISNPFTQNSPVQTTYPNIPNNDLAFLQTIQAGFAAQNKSLEEYTKSLIANLTPLGSAGNPANNPTGPTPTDIILADKTLTDEQKRAALDIITPTSYSDLNKFNPPNVFGYGALGENKQGIPLSLAQRLGITNKKLNEFTAAQIKELSNIDIKETFDVILAGKAGVNPTNFLTVFSQKVEPNGMNEIVKISDVMTAQKSTPAPTGSGIVTTAQPAKGLLGGTVYTQTKNQYGGFVGGSINPNPVDTLSEVLGLFPHLSASKAADILYDIKRQNQNGLAPSTVLTLYPQGVFRNLSSAGGDPPQMFGNNSLGIGNVSPEYISNLLTTHKA